MIVPKNRMMQLSEEDNKRLRKELLGIKEQIKHKETQLRSIPSEDKPCKWFKQRLVVGSIWMIGFMCGLQAGWRLKE